jgi:tetratricopeptide (TPR) repeat protein
MYLLDSSSSQEALQKKVQELAKNASDAASKAIQLDPTNYLNHVSRAGIGDLFATLNIDRTVTSAAARDAYIEASRLNPSSPRLEFAIGRASLLLGDRQGAILHLEKARELRPAYPEAIAALAELNRQDGKMDRAIEIATAGLQNDPSNFIILFQLGFLYYSNSDFDRAIAAFENAIAINPYYADAKYFLGVAYAEKGNREAAMKQFEEIRTLNPDNAEIKRVIKNMTEGRKPLQDQ